MLDFHNPLVTSFLLVLMSFEDGFKSRILLAVVVRICYAHVEKGVLAASPEASCPNVKAGVVVGVGGRTVIILVVDFL